MQVVVDSETFKGISSRLPELGGVVLEATQKLVRGYHGPTAQEIAAMFTNDVVRDATAVVQDLETGEWLVVLGTELVCDRTVLSFSLRDTLDALMTLWIPSCCFSCYVWLQVMPAMHAALHFLQMASELHVLVPVPSTVYWCGGLCANGVPDGRP
jgi:hypothetical protein